MNTKFNIDRPKISDEEINKHKDFDQLVRQFKQQSIQKARQDKSWWKSKKVRYSSVIAGITVVCTITYFALYNKTKNQHTNDKIVTQKTLDTKNNTQEKSRFVKPPLQKLAIPYTSYKVNNATGAEINHPSASKIKIPKNSFVDKNGRDIVGDVTIEYREFHDKGDIIVSGIPMAYDSAEKKYNLESAGMFDIKGTQNGEPVFIKPGNDLKIELASANAEDRFNQYYLDTLEKNWKYLKHDEIAKTKSSPSMPPSNQKNNNSKIAKLKEDIEVILPNRIDSVKVVYTKKADALPKAREPLKPAKPSGKPTFVIDASKEEYPEFAAFDNVIFEIGDENKNYNKSFNDITWSDVKVSEGPDKGRNYILTLILRNRVEKLVVYPVLTGADFEKARKKYQQKFAEYQTLVEKRVENEKKLLAEMEAKQKVYQEQLRQKQAEYERLRLTTEQNARMQDANDLKSNFNSMSNQVRAIRLFNVSRFGIYNSDCAKGAPEGKSVSPIFITAENNKPVMPELIYMIDHSANTVYSFGRGDLSSKIKYDPFSGNSFVIFAGNKMFLCSKESFKQTADKDSNKFVVAPLPDSSENLSDFKKALEI